MCLKLNSKTVGIIGGGQLGMMLAVELKRLGARVISLDPSADAPIKSVADELIVASFDNLEALESLCKKSDVITYEFENVRTEYLIELERKYNIKQGLSPLFDSQDRLREKENAIKHGLKPVKFYDVLGMDDLNKGLELIGYPALYKTRTLGYDGHGQVLIKTSNDIEAVKPYLNQPGILEEYLAFDFEASVIMIRSKKKTVALPLNRNIHHKGILDITYVPANIDANLEKRLIDSSKAFMESAGYEGIICIEYFIKGTEFYFNEMAPRPHNSGHYSIEGCDHSQYDLFARYLLDMELVEPKLLSPTLMKNILGKDLWMVPKFEQVSNAHIHMYNKTEARPYRKMGHVTLTETTYEQYLEIEKRM